jgi:hypothetical protein
MRMLFLQIILTVATLVFSSCCTGDNMNLEINDETIGKILQTNKAKEIERKVLLKLQKMGNENQNPESVMSKRILLAESTCTALGQDTLNYLNNVKTYTDFEKEYLKKRVIPIIKERLLLVSLLNDYLSKNQLESDIISKIKSYPAIGAKNFWSDVNAKKYSTELIYDNIKDMKIALPDNKYIYIKIYGFTDEDATRIEVSTAENGRSVFTYELKPNSTNPNPQTP